MSVVANSDPALIYQGSKVRRVNLDVRGGSVLEPHSHEGADEQASPKVGEEEVMVREGKLERVKTGV